MRNRLDEQLTTFTNELLEMATYCERMLKDIVPFMKKEGKEDQFAALESEVNHIGREIENLGMELLVRQQPVARDLRFISSGFKLIHDFRRVATQIMDMYEISEYLTEPDLLEEAGIITLSQRVEVQFNRCIECFMKMDAAGAKTVIDSDDAVDEAFADSKNKLTTIMKQDASVSGACVDLLMVAKYYERIGDHAVHIAKAVYYVATGERIRNEEDE